MLVEQVNRVDAEALELPLARAASILGATVDPGGGIAIRAHREFSGDDEALAMTLDRGAHQLFVAERSVHLCGVEERDAEVDRLVNGTRRIVMP